MACQPAPEEGESTNHHQDAVVLKPPDPGLVRVIAL
jgi:hypothetical protein